MYGPGETAQEDFHRLTGMTVKRSLGRLQTLEILMEPGADKLLPGTANQFVSGLGVYEKYYVEDENATVLGRYDSGDREAAVAAVEKDGWK